jgi:Flp pilus assembly protein TadD
MSTLQNTLVGNEKAALQELAAAVAASDLRRAAQIATAAIGSGMGHAAFYNARALWAESQGQHQTALAEFQRALAFTPTNPVLLSAIGHCLVRLNRIPEGIAHFDRALALNPADPDTHYRKGWALASAGDQVAARRSYERAIEIRPAYPEALGALAAIAARDGRRDDARNLAGQALAIDPNKPTAIIALAMCDLAERDYAAAEQRLAPMLADAGTTDHSRALALGFHADALDAQGRYNEAIAGYAAKNEVLRRMHAPRLSSGRSTAFVRMLNDQLKAGPAELWQVPRPPAAAQDGPRSHVFLLGFLRSGTTLLEQVLGANPDVAAVEERETFIDSAQKYLATADGLDRLIGASDDELNRARAQYWSRVRSFGVEPAGKVLLDKQPLNTFNLPLIARLFPEARILFALRDPRDVVLSCFRRHFEINAMVFELLTMEDAANFYDAVMTLADTCRERLPLAIHDHRYEDMVTDFDATVKAGCEFSGIDWTDKMRDFGETARKRVIRSPSAAQVRRELYADGIGQWRNYQSALEPVLPTLAKWAERFGYPPA